MSESLNLGPIDRAELDEVQAVPFEEEVEAEEALDNIEANDAADPTPIVLDAAMIPEGSTPTDFIDTWTQTGNTVVSGSDAVGSSLSPGATYRAQFAVNLRGDQGVVLDDLSVTTVEEEPQPVPELEEVSPITGRRRRGTAIVRPISVFEDKRDIPRPEGQVYGPMTHDQAVQGQKEENRRMRQEKEKKQMEELEKRVKQRDRKRLHQNENYVMGPNDLMIISDHRHRLYFQKTDTLKTGNLRELCNTNTVPCIRTGFQPNIITNGLMYDKNMNPLTISYSRNKTKSDKTFNRIDVDNTVLGKRYSMQGYDKWLVVNKTALMTSGGKDFRIRHRIGYTLQETLAIKKELVKQMTEGEEFVTYLKSLIGQIYDEKNYEIIYEYGFMPGRTHNNFHIYFQFPNLTISNSIEISHQIENLMTRWRGEHYIGRDANVFRVSGGMEGLRTSFSAKDAFHGYSHSHLSSSNFGHWDQFCMGDQHFMSNINAFSGGTSELEFETMLIAMLDHVEWESLEGGPYMKMEAIGQDGGGIVTPTRRNTLSTYGSDTLAEVMTIIKDNVDFNRLYDAFTLRPVSNKETVYTLDEKKFIQLFNKELGEDVIINFHEGWEIDPIVYVPSENVFRRSDFDVQVASSWKGLLKDARKKVSDVPITYMNGKYIRPLIVQEPKPVGKVSKKVIQSLHPDIIVYVANIIHYHLLNELKNVKV